MDRESLDTWFAEADDVLDDWYGSEDSHAREFTDNDDSDPDLPPAHDSYYSYPSDADVYLPDNGCVYYTTSTIPPSLFHLRGAQVLFFTAYGVTRSSPHREMHERRQRVGQPVYGWTDEFVTIEYGMQIDRNVATHMAFERAISHNDYEMVPPVTLRLLITAPDCAPTSGRPDSYTQMTPRWAITRSTAPPEPVLARRFRNTGPANERGLDGRRTRSGQR